MVGGWGMRSMSRTPRGQYLGHNQFCLVSWRLVDGWILYLIHVCWVSVTQTLTWIYVCRSVTYISWSSDFAFQLYLEDIVIIGILVPCDAKVCLIKCMWVSDYISWSSDFVVDLEDYLMAKCCTGDIDSVWHKHWSKTIYVGQWPIFHGLVILPYISTIWWTNVIIGILDPCDAKIYHIKCMWVSDLHFMVQWFCLISWKCFNALFI